MTHDRNYPERDDDLNRLLRGVGRTLLPTPATSALLDTPRLIEDPRLPPDTWTQANRSIGRRIEFDSDGGTVHVDISSRPAEGISQTRQDIEVWNSTTNMLAHRQPITDQTTTIGLPVPTGSTRIYLPETVATVARMWSDDTELRDPPAEPIWLAYGDSITAGECATTYSRAWPATVARDLHLDVVNLGFSGAGRGEGVVAEQMCEWRADLITVAFGSNCWRGIPHSNEQMAAITDAFLATLTRSHHGVPVVVVTPTLRPDAENEPNASGATLGTLRLAQQVAARAHASAVVDGRDLLYAEDLVDGLHPSDRGHRRYADKLTQVIRTLLGSEKPAS